MNSLYYILLPLQQDHSEKSTPLEYQDKNLTG